MEIPSLPPSTLRSFTPYLVEEDPDFDVLVLDAHGSAVEVRNRADRVQGPLSRADVFFFQGEIYIYIYIYRTAVCLSRLTPCQSPRLAVLTFCKEAAAFIRSLAS